MRHVGTTNGQSRNLFPVLATKCFLLGSRPALDPHLGFHCLCPRTEVLTPHKRHRPAAMRKSLQQAVVVLIQPLLRVTSLPDIKGAIAAFEHVRVEAHVCALTVSGQDLVPSPFESLRDEFYLCCRPRKWTCPSVKGSICSRLRLRPLHPRHRSSERSGPFLPAWPGPASWRQLPEPWPLARSPARRYR